MSSALCRLNGATLARRWARVAFVGGLLSMMSAAPCQAQPLTAAGQPVTGGPAPGAMPGMDVTPEKMVSAERDFARQMWSRVITKGTPGENVVFSPASLYQGLMLLDEGARGQTRGELRQLLGATPFETNLQARYRAIQAGGRSQKLTFAVPLADLQNRAVIVGDGAAGPTGQANSLEAGDVIFSIDDTRVRNTAEVDQNLQRSHGTVRVDYYDDSESAFYSRQPINLRMAIDPNVSEAQWPMTIASALVIRDTLAAQSPFPQAIASLYDTQSMSTDFTDPARLEMSLGEYFHGRTGGKLAAVTLPESLPEDVQFIVLCGAGMDATWQQRFNVSLTESGVFHAPGGDMTASYMTELRPARIAQFANVKVLELTYRGCDLRMRLYLPDDPALTAPVTSQLPLPSANMQVLNTLWKDALVSIRLPKFRVNATGSLKSLLEGTDFASAFTDSADFRGISEGNQLKLADIRQEVFVEIDEFGTRAAAVTQAMGIPKSLPPQPDATFHADHPFAFEIMDGAGYVHFIGLVNQPRPAQGT